MLRLGCPSAFTGLEFIVWLLEPPLRTINEPLCLGQTGLGVKAELMGTFSVLREGTDACSQRLCQVPSQAGTQSPCPAACSR